MKISRHLNPQVPSLSNSSTSIKRAIQSLHNNLNALSNGDYGHLIRFCTNHRLIRQAKQLHARLVIFKFTTDNFIASKLITFYSKSGHLYHAEKVFAKIPQRNTWSYNAMLIAYSYHDKLMDIFRLFSSFVKVSTLAVKPDNYTLTCGMKALSNLFLDANLTREIHCYVLRHGFYWDLFVFNALITYYQRCGEMGLARKVFDLMGERDIVSWNSMISGYSQEGYYEESLKLYKLMLDDVNLRPDGVTVVSVLQACARMKDLVRGMEVHRFVIENNVEMDISVYNSIIGFYAKCGSLDYARELFEEMTKRDEVTYGCLISGYLAHGYVNKAMDLFQQMDRPSLSTWNGLISGLMQNNLHEVTFGLLREMQALGIKPNSVTISSILPALSYFFNLKGGKQVHAYAIRNNLDDNIYVATGIIDIYGKSGFLQGARHVFDRSRHRSVIIWTGIIAAYAAHGDAENALILFEDMLNYGTKPDAVTFSSILTACAHLGDIDKAWEIFEDMNHKYGVQPEEEHYACMVKVLSQAGNLSEAAKLISEMPIKPCPKPWDALLNAASVQGDAELQKFASDCLSEMDPGITENLRCDGKLELLPIWKT